MSSAAKVGLLAALLLTLSLPPKFLVWQATASALQRGELDPPRQLRLGLEAIAAPVEREVRLKPGIWHGWQLGLPGCPVIALPQPEFDGTEILQRMAGSDHDLRYVYDGRISDSLPLIDTMIAKVRLAAAPFLAKPSDRLVVILVAPKGCRDYETLDWARLWQRG